MCRMMSKTLFLTLLERVRQMTCHRLLGQWRNTVNYLSNAIKHAYINSTIKIKIKENEFSIENKGKQIDENRMDSIWESFVSDDQKGTGLGLAIVRNILELHEMSYGVYNLQDGVEFYFRWKK